MSSPIRALCLPASAPRVLIIAGGTGGHIVPGLGLALELDARVAGRTFFLSLVKNREYADFQSQRFPIHFYDAPPIAKRPAALLRFPPRFFRAVLVARHLLRSERIGLVVGMGGYSIFPGLVAARLMGVPYCLCEQNAVPGRATRLFAGGARRVFLNFPVAPEHRRSFASEQLVFAGNPLRPALRELAQKTRMKAASRTPKRRLNVLVLGGSQGAAQINAMVLAAIQAFARAKAGAAQIVGRWTIQCGEKNLSGMQAQLGEIQSAAQIELLGYHPRIADFYADADLIIARAGAGVLAEALAFGLPMILVPYPFAADNHQLANAGYLEAEGAAACIRTRGTDPQELVEILSRWHADGELESRALRSAGLAMPDAAQTIADSLEELSDSALTGSGKS